MFSHYFSFPIVNCWINPIDEEKNNKKKQIIKINFTINYKNNNSVSGFENFVLELRKTIGNSRYKKTM